MREQQTLMSPILLAVGDEALRNTLAGHLQREGYVLLTAAEGETALRLAQQNPPMLVLLDRTLPPLDGLELCRLLRTYNETAWLPIMMIAMHEDETDAVVGLEVGADDYLIWPCRWYLLRARIRALLRRSRYIPDQSDLGYEKAPASQQEHKGEQIVRGDICIDPAGRVVMHREQRIALSARLFDLLVYFACHEGVVISRRQLMEQVQQDEEADERLVDVYVHWLREKLEHDLAHPRHIQTVRGVGYRFHSE
ncbi:MAG: response regulator transcription factor [Ktedonobacteraceae bacterium]|nr:response regulator transcription factor [Ktedonobacteraceae bacterium]